MLSMMKVTCLVSVKGEKMRCGLKERGRRRGFGEGHQCLSSIPQDSSIWNHQNCPGTDNKSLVEIGHVGTEFL